MKHIADILSIGFPGFGILVAYLAYKIFRDAGTKALTQNRLRVFYTSVGFFVLLSFMSLYAYTQQTRSTMTDMEKMRDLLSEVLRDKDGHIKTLNMLGPVTPQQQALIDHIRDNLLEIDKRLLERIDEA